MLLTVFFRNAGFLGGRFGFAIELTAVDVSLDLRIPFEVLEVGVVFAGFFVKKL